MAAVRSEASGYWRTVTLPFPEAGIQLLPQNSLGMFASTMGTYRERLQEAARELSGHYDTMKSEAERRLGEFRTVLAGLRQECPPALPVVVRASWLPETILGQCLRRDKRFVVLLNDKMGEPRAVEVLCHEWAHAVAWNFSVDRLINAPDNRPGSHRAGPP